MKQETKANDTYDISDLSSEYRSFVPGETISIPDERTWLERAAEEISAHVRHRYELTLRPGQSGLTHNEVIGIIAKNFHAK
jgi:hypothetical protein